MCNVRGWDVIDTYTMKLRRLWRYTKLSLETNKLWALFFSTSRFQRKRKKVRNNWNLIERQNCRRTRCFCSHATDTDKVGAVTGKTARYSHWRRWLALSSITTGHFLIWTDATNGDGSHFLLNVLWKQHDEHKSTPIIVLCYVLLQLHTINDISIIFFILHAIEAEKKNCPRFV